MKKRKIRPPKVEFEFTDLDLTAFGGASILARTAQRFGLFELLDEAVKVKVRARGAAVRFAERVAPAIVGHELETRGYVPLFIDGTGIELDGHLFERARRNYDGNRGYWLHATFVGGLWTAGQLQPGGGGVTLNWRKLLEWSAGTVPAGTLA